MDLSLIVDGLNRKENSKLNEGKKSFSQPMYPVEPPCDPPKWVSPPNSPVFSQRKVQTSLRPFESVPVPGSSTPTMSSNKRMDRHTFNPTVAPLYPNRAQKHEPLSPIQLPLGHNTINEARYPSPPQPVLAMGLSGTHMPSFSFHYSPCRHLDHYYSEPQSEPLPTGKYCYRPLPATQAYIESSKDIPELPRRISESDTEAVSVTNESPQHKSNESTWGNQKFRDQREIPSQALSEHILILGKKGSQKTCLSMKTRQYACQDCGRSFFRKSDLVRHIQIHLGIKPNTCHVCGKQFIQRSALTVHLRVHTGEKPYICNVCKRAFSDSSSLARHRRLHLRKDDPKLTKSKLKTVTTTDYSVTQGAATS